MARYPLEFGCHTTRELFRDDLPVFTAVRPTLLGANDPEAALASLSDLVADRPTSDTVTPNSKRPLDPQLAAGGPDEDDPLYEMKRRQRRETLEEDIQHGRPVPPREIVPPRPPLPVVPFRPPAIASPPALPKTEGTSRAPAGSSGLPPLRRMHPDQTIMSNNRSSYDYWSAPRVPYP